MEINIFIDKTFELGKADGFTDMEIYYVEGESFEAAAFEGKLDSYKINTNIGLSFRGIMNGGMGYAFTERFEEEDIQFLLQNAAQNAAEVQSDVTPSLFEGCDSYRVITGIEYKDKPVKDKIADTLNMEASVRGYDNRVKSVKNCVVSTGKGKRKIINTKGMNLEESDGFAVKYVSVVAQSGEEIKSGSMMKVSKDYDKINEHELISKAVEDAVSRFGAATVPTGKYKVILRYDAAASLLATFSSIFSSDSAQKGLSLLKERVGETIASAVVNIIDNPFFEEAPTQCSFDDEGIATFEKHIVKDGILNCLLYNLKTAAKDQVSSTGNGFKASYKSPVGVAPTNFYIAAGSKSFEQAVEELSSAIIITDLKGLHAGANSISGDFSLSAEGFLVEQGRIVRAVEQITVADNFYEVLKKIEEVLSDFEISIPSSSSFGSASLVISEMSVSGA